MFFLAPMLIAAALAATKHFAVDKPQEKSDRELAAKTQELSPWTGLKADPVQRADLAGSVLSGAATGAQFGTSIHQAEQQDEMNDVYKNWMSSQTLKGRDISPMVASRQGFTYQPNNGWSLLRHN